MVYSLSRSIVSNSSLRCQSICLMNVSKSKLCALRRKAGANIKPFSNTHNTFSINFEKKYDCFFLYSFSKIIKYSSSLVPGITKNFNDIDELNFLEDLNKFIENKIKLNPQEYLWQHRRFKSTLGKEFYQ